jgi:hypothetical protein
MTTFLPLVTLLLILAMMCFLLYYFYIQQSLETLSRQLASMQPSQASVRGPDLIRREKAYRHDQLVLLEAELSNYPRAFLTEEEMTVVEVARKNIKHCIDELKQSGEWLGLPFDFEWSEMVDRVPKVISLYRLTLAQSSWGDSTQKQPEDVVDVSRQKNDAFVLRLA